MRCPSCSDYLGYLLCYLGIFQVLFDIFLE
jgi:hypothetical protein